MRLPKLSPRTIKGVLFDLDGTCVDSEFLSPLVWAAVLKEIPGIDTSSIDHKAMENALTDPSLRGASASDVGNHLLKTFDIHYNDDPNTLVKRKRALAVEMVVNGHVDLEPLWFKGLTGRIRQLEKALGPGNVGLCTSNMHPIVKATIEAGDLGDSFHGGRTVQEDVICPDSGLPNIKPDPSLYKLALEKLNLPPKFVVAFEDSVVGVTSAKNAGVGSVLGVLNREDNNTKEASAVEKALLDAGADTVFNTTVDAIDWCLDCCSTAGQNVTDLRVMQEKEEVVNRYFDGVNKQDGDLMASCFADKVELRDMCGPSKGKIRYATNKDMADRCLEFLAAHPDCKVEFTQPPTCDRKGEWVWAHWFETGNWTGESLGVKPMNTPLDVGGHTRFLLEKQDCGKQKIVKQVVYRTFSDWELSLS